MYSQTKSHASGGQAHSDGGGVVQSSCPAGPPKHSWDSLAAFTSADYHAVLTRLANKYGSVFELRISGRRLVVLSGLSAIRDALVNQSDKFTDRADFQFFKEEPQGHFIELKSGASWKKHHDVAIASLRDAFGGRWGEIEGLLSLEADDLVGALEKVDGRPVDPGRAIAIANFSFWQNVVFGRRCESWEKDLLDDKGVSNIPEAFMNKIRVEIAPSPYREILLLRNWSSFMQFRKSLAGISGYIKGNVDEHRKSLKMESPRDITDLLLKATHGIPEEEQDALQLYEEDLVAGTITQMSTAGTGVPSFAVRWALLYMLHHPRVQARIQGELDAVVGRDRVPSLSDRSRCVYTQACIHEVLRHSGISSMAPVYYACTREAIVDGVFVAGKTPVLVNYYSLTRDPELWVQPDAFDPERFLDGKGNIRKDAVGQFYPFGVGERRCLGEHVGRMQIFVLLTRLLHEFSFEPAPGKLPSLKARPGAFLVPRDYRLVARPRHGQRSSASDPGQTDSVRAAADTVPSGPSAPVS